MKTLYKILILALAVTSCSLEENTDALSTPDNFFRKYSECQSVVNSCYQPIKSIYTAPFFMATECATDIMWIASGTLDAQLDISPVKPRFGATVWDQCYQGIRRCNFAVYGLVCIRSDFAASPKHPCHYQNQRKHDCCYFSAFFHFRSLSVICQNFKLPHSPLYQIQIK